MAIEDDIIQYLNNKEKGQTVSEIAKAIDYSKGYTRKNCKKLRDEGKILGDKNKPVPGCVREDGELTVLTSDRDKLLELAHDELGISKDFFRGKSIKEIQKFLRKEICESTPIINNAWVFWT